MKESSSLHLLDSLFPMIGLSADWIYQTWLIKGNRTQGVVIFENEDNSTYELVEFYYENEERIENVIFSGLLSEVICFSFIED